jgi:threonine synthase
MLPILDSFGNAVTLREGNTPLYHLPRAAKALGDRSDLRQASGDESDRLLQRYRDDIGAERGQGAWLRVGGLRFDGQHLRGDGGLCGAGGTEVAGADSAGQDCVGQAGAVDGLRRGDLPAQDGFRRLREGAFDHRAGQAPIYLLNSVNPYRLEGQKTPALEIAEYFDWSVPEHILVPGGNLANSAALGKGFREMKALGLISRLPKISVIQAEGANPLVRSFVANDGEKIEPVVANTRATAIRIGNPASWRKASVIHETGGWCLDVSEGEIAVAKAELGREGIGCEPASAVTLAGLKKLRGARQSCAFRHGGAAADRSHAQGCRLHHRLPSRHAAERRGS